MGGACGREARSDSGWSRSGTARLRSEARSSKPIEAAPSREQRLLHGVLGILQRAEDSVAVQLQLPPVGRDQVPEGDVVAGAGAAERVLAHDRVTD